MSDSSSSAANPSQDQPQAGAEFRPLRIWPVILLVLLMIGARFVTFFVDNGPALLWMVPAFLPPLCGVLMVIWWIGASRARWFERLIGFVGIAGIVTVTLLLLHPTMRGPGFTVVSIPIGMGAFALGALLGRNGTGVSRTLRAVFFAACGFAATLALRADGLWGDYAVELHWRWTPSAEDKLLAARDRATSERVGALSPESLAEPLAHPEWPAFRGADRSGRQRGTRLATDWAQQKPRELWKIAVGPAWSSFVVAGPLLFTQEQRGDRETTVAYEANTGREVWTQAIDTRFDEPLGGPGPRATPTLADGKLYVQGAQGHVLRLDAATGNIEWKQDLRELARPTPPTWGFTASPLVEQGLVIVHAGGPEKKGLLALDAATGELRWSVPSGDHTYSSPQICEILGQRCVAMVTNQGIDLLDPTTGEDRLRYAWSSDAYRVSQPLMIGDDSLLLPTGMGMGTRRLRFERDGEKLKAEEVWTSLQLKPDFNDPVIFGDHAYGFDGPLFTCIDLAHGKRQWKGGRYGKGQVLLVEDSGVLLVAGEYGDVVLLKADPAEHVELGRFKAIEGKTWNHPVLIGDRLYIRNAEEAACWQLPTQAADKPDDAADSAASSP